MGVFQIEDEPSAKLRQAVNPGKWAKLTTTPTADGRASFKEWGPFSNVNLCSPRNRFISRDQQYLRLGSWNHRVASLLAHWHNHFWRNVMKNLAILLAVGASALLVTAASAAPLSAGVSVTPDSNIQNVRMVCNEDGRCWRERGERRVIIRDPNDSYGYAPRAPHIERRGYEERGGIGFSAPGVSVGIGTDRY
jgi:hypothetical protein